MDESDVSGRIIYGGGAAFWGWGGVNGMTVSTQTPQNPFHTVRKHCKKSIIIPKPDFFLPLNQEPIHQLLIKNHKAGPKWAGGNI